MPRLRTPATQPLRDEDLKVMKELSRNPLWVRSAFHDLNRRFKNSYFDSQASNDDIIDQLVRLKNLLQDVYNQDPTSPERIAWLRKLRRARPQTLLLIAKVMPSFPLELTDTANHWECDGILKQRCGHCEKRDACHIGLKWFTRFPWFVMDLAMQLLTGNSWKVLCYLSRRCTFAPDRHGYGQCRISYSDIKVRTGVKQPARCIRQLIEHDFISLEQIQTRGTAGSRTINHFTVNWYDIIKEYGHAASGPKEESQ